MLATNRSNYSALLAKVGTVQATPAEIAANSAAVAQQWHQLGRSDRTAGLGCRWPRVEQYLEGYNYDTAQPTYLTDALCANGAQGYRFTCQVRSNVFVNSRETVDALVAVPSQTALNRLVKQHFGSDAFVSSYELAAAPF